jgi:hypothetical protein
MRDVAAAVGITERAVQAIVADLEAAAVLERTRVGRRAGDRNREQSQHDGRGPVLEVPVPRGDGAP